ncbi:MAG: hypothetical protein ACLS37_13110 [Alistipes sp.]
MEKMWLRISIRMSGINNGCYFGLPFTPEEAQLVLLPVPWEVTASYGGGTASAPDAILDASMQVDLPLYYPGGWERGIGTSRWTIPFSRAARGCGEGAARDVAPGGRRRSSPN